MRIELLHRLIAGTTTADENRQLMEWFRQTSSKEEFFRLFESAWKESSEEMPKDVQERMYRRLSRNLDREGKQTSIIPLSRRSFRNYWMEIAAACAILILCIVNYTFVNKQMQFSAQNFTVVAEKGQRAYVTLPDSTKVWLNSDTKITYPANYGMKERNVSLDGEAYFEVAKNPEKRFIVEANGMEVEALGTSFNVNAYKNDKQIIATLFSGSVRITYETYKEILKPNESVKVDLLTHKILLSKESYRKGALWRENEIVFEGETLGEIAHIMNRLYNTNIYIEDETLKNECYVGIIRNNSLENFIDIINLTTPITYENRGDTLFLKRKTD